MIPPTPVTPCTRCLPVIWAEYSRIVKNLPRKRCNVVMSDNPSTADLDAVLDTEASTLVENQSVNSQTRQWQPATFVLKNVVDDAWRPSNA